MKKLHRFLAGLLILTLLAGCGSAAAPSSSTAPAAPASSTAPASSEAEPEAAGPIAVILPGATHGWTAGAAYFALEKLHELGLKEGEGYKLLTSSNVNEQANQIEEVLATGVSAVVLLPHNNEVSVAADKIVDAGVPLVVFDRKVPNYDYYVAGNNPGHGQISAEYLGEQLGGKGKIAVMNTPSKGSVSSERVEGFKGVMAEKYPEIELVDVTSDGFSREDGLRMATDMLVAHPQLDAVFSIDDEPSLGILQAITEAGRTDIKYLTGGGGNQAYLEKIKENADPNITLLTATYSPGMIAEAIQVAFDLLNGKTPAEEIIIPSVIVTKENAADYIDASSPY